MANLLLPHKWRRQPQYPVSLDESHPLLEKFEVVWLGSNLRDFRFGRFGRQAVTFSGTNAQHLTPRGNIAWNTSAANAVNIDWPVQDSTTPWTLAGLFMPTGPLSGGANISVAGLSEDPGSNTHDRHIKLRASSIWAGYLFDSGTGETFAGTTVSAAVGREDAVIACANGSEIRCAANGVEAATATNSTGYNGYVSPVLSIGNASTVNEDDIAVSLLVRTRTAWDYGQRRAFYENPWQIFRPLKRRIYVHVGGGQAPRSVHQYRMRRAA